MGEIPHCTENNLRYTRYVPHSNIAYMNNPIRLVLVDDHDVIRDLFRYQLGRSEPHRYEIVGEGSTGQEAVEICLRTQPDLLVLDLMLPGLNGVEVLRRLQPKLPRMRVLFFSATSRTPLIVDALELGANGFVGKPRSWQTVLGAVNLVAAGGKYFDPAVAHLAGRTARQPEPEELTAREREVAQLIAEGNSTKEIASLLGVSVKTIDKHRTRMMEKLHVHDAVAVTRYAINAGLVTLE